MNDIETGVVTRLVAFLAERGYKPVQANDGEDWEPIGPTAKDVIEAVEATGDAWIRFDNGKLEPRPRVWLIQGNGTDICSDWSTSITPDMDAFCDKEEARG